MKRFAIGLLVVPAFAAGCAAVSSEEISASDESRLDVNLAEDPPPATTAEIEPEVQYVPLRYEEGGDLFDMPVKVIGHKTIFEGDIELPSSVMGATIIGRRWLNKTVPYIIPSNLPHPERITQSIAHWEANTELKFVVRTNQADYVRFNPGRGCSAMVGRRGGMQDITLTQGSHITTLVGADFNKTNAQAHFWFRDGVHTVGKSWNVDETTVGAPYVIPAGKSFTDIRDTAFAANGDVYTWYLDGTVSIGTPENLGSKAAPVPFVVPNGVSVSSIVGIAFLKNGHVRAWYANGTTSEGSAYNLASFVAPENFTAATGQAINKILAVGVSGDTIYAWYPNSKASGGTVTELEKTHVSYAVSTPGHCGPAQIIHEIGHAVGFQHEQTRHDRDQYITINFDNITPANKYNFEKHNSSSQDLGPYDLMSVMHYDSWAFSKNGQATILKKDGGVIYDPSVLSPGDIAVVGMMYP